MVRVKIDIQRICLEVFCICFLTLTIQRFRILNHTGGGPNGLLPIRGTLPPLARIGNFHFFFGYFLEGGGHNWEKNFIPFLHVLEHINHF